MFTFKWDSLRQGDFPLQEVSEKFKMKVKVINSECLDDLFKKTIIVYDDMSLENAVEFGQWLGIRVALRNAS